MVWGVVELAISDDHTTFWALPLSITIRKTFPAIEHVPSKILRLWLPSAADGVYRRWRTTKDVISSPSSPISTS